jgi:hypothetical protein
VSVLNALLTYDVLPSFGFLCACPGALGDKESVAGETRSGRFTPTNLLRCGEKEGREFSSRGKIAEFSFSEILSVRLCLRRNTRFIE